MLWEWSGLPWISNIQISTIIQATAVMNCGNEKQDSSLHNCLSFDSRQSKFADWTHHLQRFFGDIE